jgi:hypothetical protein
LNANIFSLDDKAPLYTLTASPQRNQKKQLGYLKSLREARLLCNRARMAANIPRIFLAGIAAYSLTPRAAICIAFRGHAIMTYKIVRTFVLHIFK